MGLLVVPRCWVDCGPLTVQELRENASHSFSFRTLVLNPREALILERHPIDLPGRRGSRALIVQALVPFLLLAAAFALAAFTVGLQDVRNALGSVGAQAIVLMLCASAFNYLARSVRWLLMFRTVDPQSSGSSISQVPHQFLVYLGGYAFTVTPGRAGEAVRVWMAYKSFGTKVHVGASLVVADRFYDAVALTLILLGAAALYAKHTATVAVMAAVLTAAVLFLGWAATTPGLWQRAIGFAPRLAKPIGGLRDMITQLSVLSSPRRMPLLALVSAAGWTAQGLVPAIVLRDMGVALNFPDALFVFALATLVGGATFLPGGLGGFEVTMVGLLSAMGVPLATAVAATLVIRLTTLWFGVLLGVIMLTVWTFVSGGRKHDGAGV